MSKRISKAMLFSTFLTLILSFILIFSVLYAYFIDMGIAHMKSEMVHVKYGYINEGLDYFAKIGNDEDRITLISSDGTVFYDSIADITKMDNHGTRPEVKQAFANGTGTDNRLSDTVYHSTLYYAVKLDDGSILRLGSTRYSFVTLIFGIMQPFIVILGVIIILSIYMSWKTAKMIVKPINALDLENPEKNTADEELTPLLRKIVVQKVENDEKIAELRQKQYEFNAITENMQEGFMLLNQNSEILVFNQSASNILGEIKIGSSLLAVNRGEFFRHLVDDIRLGKKADNIMEIDARHYQIICNPVHKKKATAGAVLLIMDVTEKLERERLRREFSANVSHELKTPLTSISGYAEIMMNGLAPSEDTKKFAEKIFTEAKRLVRLIGDILDLSKLDESESLPDKENVDLSALCSTQIEVLSDAAKRKDVKFTIKGEKIVVSGYRQILEEMVYNLCDNAVKYNRSGGEVTIETANENGLTVLSVSDTGIGIPKGEQVRVFERFYRIDKARSKDTGGTGLGLSIVKHAAMLHNAEILLDSEVDKGTKITLIFR